MQIEAFLVLHHFRRHLFEDHVKISNPFCHGSFLTISPKVKDKFLELQYSHREIPISPARLGDTFCCLGDFLSFHRDNRYSQRDIQVTQRDVVTVHRV